MGQIERACQAERFSEELTMDCYEIWCDLIDGRQDMAFCEAVDNYLGYLKARDLIERFRVRRRKFGFSPTDMPEFNVSMEFRDLTQMDAAFGRVAVRDAEIEALHVEVYSRVKNAKFALFRDFPDPVRERPSPTTEPFPPGTL